MTTSTYSTQYQAFFLNILSRSIENFLAPYEPAKDFGPRRVVCKIIKPFSLREAIKLLGQAGELFEHSQWTTDQKISVLQVLARVNSSARSENIEMTLELSSRGNWKARHILSALRILLNMDPLIKTNIISDTLRLVGSQIRSGSNSVKTLETLNALPYLDKPVILQQLQFPPGTSLKLANKFLKIFASYLPEERRRFIQTGVIECALSFVTERHTIDEIEEAIEIIDQIDPSERKQKIELVNEWTASGNETALFSLVKNEILDLLKSYSPETIKILIEQTDKLLEVVQETFKEKTRSDTIKILGNYPDPKLLTEQTLRFKEFEMWFPSHLVRALSLLSSHPPQELEKLVEDTLGFISQSSNTSVSRLQTLELLGSLSEPERSNFLQQLASQLPDYIPLSSANIFLSVGLTLDPSQKELFFEKDFIMQVVYFLPFRYQETDIKSVVDLFLLIPSEQRASLVAEINEWLPRTIDVKSKNTILTHYVALSAEERALLRKKTYDWPTHTKTREASRVLCEIAAIKVEKEASGL